MEPEEKEHEAKLEVSSDAIGTETINSGVETSVDLPPIEDELHEERGEVKKESSETSDFERGEIETASHSEISSTKETKLLQLEETAGTSSSKPQTKSKENITEAGQKSELEKSLEIIFSKKEEANLPSLSQKKASLVPEVKQRSSSVDKICSERLNVSLKLERNSKKSLETDFEKQSECSPVLKSSPSNENSEFNLISQGSVVHEKKSDSQSPRSQMNVDASEDILQSTLNKLLNAVFNNVQQGLSGSGSVSRAESSEVRSAVQMSAENSSENSESRKYVNPALLHNSKSKTFSETDCLQTMPSHEAKSSKNILSAQGTFGSHLAHGTISEESSARFVSSKESSEISSTTDEVSTESPSGDSATMTNDASTDCPEPSIRAIFNSRVNQVPVQGTSKSFADIVAVTEKTSGENTMNVVPSRESEVSSTVEEVSTDSSSEDSELRRINEASGISYSSDSNVSLETFADGPSHERNGAKNQLTFEGATKSLSGTVCETGESLAHLESVKESFDNTLKTNGVTRDPESAKLEDNDAFLISSASNTTSEPSVNSSESLSHKSEGSTKKETSEINTSFTSGIVEPESFGESSALLTSKESPVVNVATVGEMSAENLELAKLDNNPFPLSLASNTPLDLSSNSPQSSPSDESEGPASKVPRLE